MVASTTVALAAGGTKGSMSPAAMSAVVAWPACSIREARLRGPSLQLHAPRNVECAERNAACARKPLSLPAYCGLTVP